MEWNKLQENEQWKNGQQGSGLHDNEIVVAGCDTCLQQLNEIKKFNYKYIYNHKRLRAFKDYSSMIITNIFDILLECYDGKHTWENLENEVYDFSPTLAESFSKFLARYCDPEIIPHTQRYELKPLALKCENRKIYGDLGKREIYI